MLYDENPQAVGLQRAGVLQLIAVLQSVIEDICRPCGTCEHAPCIENYHEAIIIANSCNQ